MYVRFLFILLLPLSSFAQAPQKINFQSILRNTNGEVVANKSVSLKISILSGSINGSSVYSETHTKTTDASGLISLQMGNGTALSGVFGNIDWGSAAHFIKLEADFNGGSNYVVLGTQELMSVPYALYATKTDTGSLNLVNRFGTKVNISDTASMLSNYKTGLNNKAPINNPTFTGTVKGIDKNMVGLGNVDNTSDANKPISTATQTALNSKVNISDTASMLANYRTGLNGKVNISDTASMLDNYRTGLNSKVNISDTTSMLANYRTGLNSKVNISDTASMLSNYRTALNSKVNISDTASMLANYRTVIAELKNQIEQLSSYTSLLASGLVDIDGNNYPVVKIGNQIWMKENLKVTKYNDGTAIPLDASGGSGGNASGQTWLGLTTGARTVYAHDNNNLTTYGYLYNWYAASGIVTSGGSSTKNICPTGWHVPTDAEWTTLTTYLGGEGVAGGKMKETGTTLWNADTDATNGSGFSARPGGFRSFSGSFLYSRDIAIFLSATEYDVGIAWNRLLFSGDGRVERDLEYKRSGLSVRCLKD